MHSPFILQTLPTPNYVGILGFRMNCCSHKLDGPLYYLYAVYVKQRESIGHILHAFFYSFNIASRCRNEKCLGKTHHM